MIRERSFYRKTLSIMMPIAMQNIVTVGVNLTDSIMLGSFGEAQLSAVSLAGQFYNSFHILCMGICTGATVLLARFWGEKNDSEFRNTVTFVLRICIAVGIAFSGVAILFPSGIMHLYTKEDSIISYGANYLLLVGVTFFLHAITLACTIILRSAGNVRVPLISSISSFLINIFFNWVFIFGNLGAPRLEIMGAALGTLIARSWEFLLICGWFFLKENHISYRLKHIGSKYSSVIPIYFRLALPVFFSDLMLAAGNSVIAMIVGHMGENFTAAYSIASLMVQLSTVFILGMANASCIITGQAIGEDGPTQAQDMGMTFFVLALIMGLLSGGAITICSPLLIDYYHISYETEQIARQLLSAVGFMVVFQSLASVMSKGVLRGGGDTQFLLVIDSLFLWLVSIPVGFFAAIVIRMPPFWIYVCLRLDAVLKSLCCVWRLYRGKWIRKLK